MAVFTRFEGNTRHPQPGVNAGRARAPLMPHVEDGRAALTIRTCDEGWCRREAASSDQGTIDGITGDLIKPVIVPPASPFNNLASKWLEI